MKNTKFSKAVVIGRFQPVMHKGHVSMIRKGLETAKLVYILIGSSNHFPDVRNPISSAERVDCIRDILSTFTTDEQKRIKVKLLDDHKYNDEKWKAEVRLLVDEHKNDKVAMIGFDKDEDSYWLHEFGWKHIAVEPFMVNWLGKNVPMSSTFIRDHWLRTSDVILKDCLPEQSVKFLESFTRDEYMDRTPEFNRLSNERLHWDKEIKKFETYPYKGSMHHVCADAVVLCNNHVLVIERKFAPGLGAWAIPGGHKDETETFRYAALRELEEEVGLKVPSKVIRGSIQDQHLFDDPKRTAAFCKPTMAQFIILQPNNDGSLPKTQAGDDAKAAFWVPLHEVIRNKNKFFDDHYQIIQFFTGI